MVEIVKVQTHPHAVKLKICLVDDGLENTQVVCGASNVKEKMKTIFAPLGSTIPSGLEIKKVDLRGIASEGMLCSARDLGLSNEGGIVDLPKDMTPGTPLQDVSPEYLSSIPWYSFKEIEAFWDSPSQSRITIQRDGLTSIEIEKELKLLSKTYFDGKNYCYRHFI